MYELLCAVGFLVILFYPFVLVILGLARWIEGRLNPEAKRPMKPIWRRKAGLPLLLFPLVAVMVTKNLTLAVKSARARHAMADLRSISTAAEQFSVDHNSYPVAASIDELARILEPQYVKKLPHADDWGNPYRYFVRRIQKDEPQNYVVVCLGSDGIPEVKDPWSYPQGPTTDYANDIVYSDGQFIRYPEGRSQLTGF